MNLDETEQLAADMRAAHLIKTIMERNKELEASIQKLQSDYDAVGAGGVSAQRVTQGKDHIEQPLEMVAAPVVLPEPGINTASHAGFRVIGYTEQQVRELLDKAACTKSQAAAQEPFATSDELFCEMCGQKGVRRIDGEALPDRLYAAPQPQEVPEGWKLVPERPTQNMCDAAKYGVDGLDAERVDALYKALEVCSAELFAQCAHQGRAMKYVEQARKALAAEQCAGAAIAKATGAHHDRPRTT